MFLLITETKVEIWGDKCQNADGVSHHRKTACAYGDEKYWRLPHRRQEQK